MSVKAKELKPYQEVHEPLDEIPGQKVTVVNQQ